MINRYQVESHVPPCSADAVTNVMDAESDAEDTMVTIDPDGILSAQSRALLASLVAVAMSTTKFKPEYADWLIDQ